MGKNKKMQRGFSRRDFLKGSALAAAAAGGILPAARIAWAAAGKTAGASPITFNGEELLGKPTNNSITVNIIPNAAIEYHYQYGTSQGSYGMQTFNSTAVAGQPHEIVIAGLKPNSLYWGLSMPS